MYMIVLMQIVQVMHTHKHNMYTCANNKAYKQQQHKGDTQAHKHKHAIHTQPRTKENCVMLARMQWRSFCVYGGRGNI